MDIWRKRTHCQAKTITPYATKLPNCSMKYARMSVIRLADSDQLIEAEVWQTDARC